MWTTAETPLALALQILLVLMTIVATIQSFRRRERPVLWWRVAAVMFWLAVTCIVGFAVIGTHIDAQGMVHEPFALLPLGYLAMLAGLFACGIQWFVSRRAH